MTTLGKLRKPGECFLHTTRPQTRWQRHKYAPYHLQEKTPVVVILKPGSRGFFTKGKRRYWCEVLALVETRTGKYNIPYGPHPPEMPIHTLSLRTGKRWWQFTYLVRIIEN